MTRLEVISTKICRLDRKTSFSRLARPDELAGPPGDGSDSAANAQATATASILSLRNCDRDRAPKSTFDTYPRGNFEAQRHVGPFDDFDRPLADARANRRGCNAAADSASGSKQGGSRRDLERRLHCTRSPTRLLGYWSRCAAFAALDFLARVKAP
jgi:hypothetical protein